MEAPKIQPIEEQPSLSEQVYAALREAILSGVFAPGDQVHEGEIAKQLNVSKTPVREALSSLRAKGLLVPSPKRGILVAEVDARSVRELYEVRVVLEPEAIRHSVRSADTKQVAARGHALLDEAQRHGMRQDLNAMSQFNRDFHELLYEGCENAKMKLILNDMRDQLQFAAVWGWRGVTSSWEYERTEHLAILEAVAEGDAERAAELSKEHIERAGAKILSVRRPMDPDNRVVAISETSSRMSLTDRDGAINLPFRPDGK